MNAGAPERRPVPHTILVHIMHFGRRGGDNMCEELLLYCLQTERTWSRDLKSHLECVEVRKGHRHTISIAGGATFMHRVVLLGLIVVTAGGAFAQTPLPTSLEQYQGQIAAKATEPKAALKLWMDAIYVYTGGNKELGRQLITAMIKDKDWPLTMSYFVDALNNHPHIFASYAKGATPDNGYTMDPTNYQLVFQGEPNLHPFADYEEGRVVKLTIVSGGTELPRPVFLERNRLGQYKLREFSSLCVGVQPPVEDVIMGDSLEQSTDPHWVFKHWLQGMLRYQAGQQDAGGAQMLSVMKDEDLYALQRYSALNEDRAYIFRSYVKGTTVDDAYACDPEDFETDTYLRPEPGPEDTSCTLWVKTTGGNSDRPLKMERDDRGQWRITELTSICVGLSRVPADPNEGDF